MRSTSKNYDDGWRWRDVTVTVTWRWCDWHDGDGDDIEGRCSFVMTVASDAWNGILNTAFAKPFQSASSASSRMGRLGLRRIYRGFIVYKGAATFSNQFFASLPMQVFPEWRLMIEFMDLTRTASERHCSDSAVVGIQPPTPPYKTVCLGHHEETVAMIQNITMTS